MHHDALLFSEKIAAVISENILLNKISRVDCSLENKTILTFEYTILKHVHPDFPVHFAVIDTGIKCVIISVYRYYCQKNLQPLIGTEKTTMITMTLTVIIIVI